MTTTIGWATKGDEIITIDGHDFTLLDGMLEAQNDIGFSVHWNTLTSTVVRGQYTDLIGVLHRVIVVDLDNADVKDAVAATMWVNAGA